MTAIAMPPASVHLQNSSSSCAGDTPPIVEKPKMTRFYCSDVPDLSDYFYSKRLSDVNIVIGDRKISAHRSRLASVSPFLADLFSADTSDVSTVILPDVAFQSVNILINFLYSGFMRVTKKEVNSVIQVASMLGINYPIDIEETEVGVVRIKPADAKKRGAAHEFGGHGFLKKPRREMPKVVIYEGVKGGLCSINMESLSTPQVSPRSSSRMAPATYDLPSPMDVDEITILPSSIISQHNFDQVPEVADTIIFLDNQSVSPELPVVIPPLSSSPRPRSRIKKTKTRDDLRNEAQLSQLARVSTPCSDISSKDSPVPHFSGSPLTVQNVDPIDPIVEQDKDTGDLAENLDDSDHLQPIVLSVEGNTEIQNNQPQTLTALAEKACSQTSAAEKTVDELETDNADSMVEVADIVPEETVSTPAENILEEDKNSPVSPAAELVENIEPAEENDPLADSIAENMPEEKENPGISESAQINEVGEEQKDDSEEKEEPEVMDQNTGGEDKIESSSATEPVGAEVKEGIAEEKDDNEVEMQTGEEEDAAAEQTEEEKDDNEVEMQTGEEEDAAADQTEENADEDSLQAVDFDQVDKESEQHEPKEDEAGEKDPAVFEDGASAMDAEGERRKESSDSFKSLDSLGNDSPSKSGD